MRRFKIRPFEFRPKTPSVCLRCLELEESPPVERTNSFDVVVLESCLHDFFDPVSATKHLATVMNRWHRGYHSGRELNRAFNPSWKGSDDARLLSFFGRTSFFINPCGRVVDLRWQTHSSYML